MPRSIPANHHTFDKLLQPSFKLVYRFYIYLSTFFSKKLAFA